MIHNLLPFWSSIPIFCRISYNVTSQIKCIMICIMICSFHNARLDLKWFFMMIGHSPIVPREDHFLIKMQIKKNICKQLQIQMSPLPRWAALLPCAFVLESHNITRRVCSETDVILTLSRFVPHVCNQRWTYMYILLKSYLRYLYPNLKNSTTKMADNALSSLVEQRGMNMKVEYVKEEGTFLGWDHVSYYFAFIGKS